MPEAMQEGSTYVLVDEMGHKTRFVYRGRNEQTNRLRLEVNNEVKEYSDLTSLADGHFSALIDVDLLH